MITEGTNKFTRYAIFSLCVCATMFAVDQYLVLHPTTEVSHETRPMKSYSVDGKVISKKNAANVEKWAVAQVSEGQKPKFKKQVKLESKFKTTAKEPLKDSVQEKNEEIVLSKSSINEPQKDLGFFEALAESYQKRVIDQLGNDKHRRDIIIRYYTHSPDGQKVYSLRKLGFYIHERPVDDPLDDYESNAIFYGDEVSKEDLQLVIYTLLKQGLPIKHISPSQFHDSWKSSSIEIGTDTTANDKSIITFSQVQRLTL